MFVIAKIRLSAKPLFLSVGQAKKGKLLVSAFSQCYRVRSTTWSLHWRRNGYRLKDSVEQFDAQSAEIIDPVNK